MENQKPTVVDVVDVRREGKTLILPEGMSYDRAIDILTRQKEYEQQVVNINADFDALPQEGAYALNQVLKRDFGYALAMRTMRGDPQSIEVQVGVNETVAVPWGAFEVPGVEGRFSCGVNQNDHGVVQFVIQAQVLRKYEQIVHNLIAAVRDEIRNHSIYKGKAWRYRLRDDDGERLMMATPQFIELDPKVEDHLTFPDDVMAAINTNLWVYIEHTDAMRKTGNPLRRGVLMAGTYGTGKSMTANVTALKAIRHGWTYIVVDRAPELAEVARIARRYGPAVLFCEDIDRVASGDRSIGLDELLNVVDGVESKASELIIVLTTNDWEAIHEAMLRPGRIDGVIFMREPDAKAVEKLLRVYLGDILPTDEDITEACELLASHKTAAAREAATRTKAAAIANTGEVPSLVTAADVKTAALSVVNQMNSLLRPAKEHLTPVERAARTMARGMVAAQATTPAHAAEAFALVEKGTPVGDFRDFIYGESEPLTERDEGEQTIDPPATPVDDGEVA